MKKIENLTLEDIKRFKSKIITNENGCGIWTGARDKDGYAMFYHNKKRYRASRVSYTIYKGEIPPGMLVCHHCDCVLCVNSEHLFLGSPADNMIDKMNKGRGLHSAETKLKISQGGMGKIQTKEKSERISLALKGRKFSDSHRLNLRNVKLGTKASDATKIKMSKIRTGKKHTLETVEKMKISMKGLKRTDEAKLNMSIAKKKTHADRPKEDHVCKGCGISFVGSYQQQYCSVKCRDKKKYQRKERIITVKNIVYNPDVSVIDIPGYEGLYAIDKDNRIWSYPKKGILPSGVSYINNGGWLKPQIAKGRSNRVSLYKDGISKVFTISKISAKTNTNAI